MKKKVLAALLTSALAVTMLAGCGSTADTTTTDDAATTDTTAAADDTADDAAADEAAASNILGNGDTVKLGVEVYDTTDEQWLAIQKYFDYLADTFDNLEFVYSESLADADAEISFIDSCAAAGCNGIVGYYNISEEAAVDECEAQGMYYWGTNDLYETYKSDDLYVGAYNFLSDKEDANGDYLGGYYMAQGLADAGCTHVFYCSGGYGMNIPMFIDRYNGFLDGITDAQAAGSSIQYDPTTDVIDGWPDADGFAQNAATMLDGDYDGAGCAFNCAALFQPIETAGKSDSIKLATIGEVSDTYSVFVASGEVNTVVYDCEEVVFGNAVVLLANAIQGTPVVDADGNAVQVLVDRWVVNDEATYTSILDFHNGGDFYITAEDVNSLMGADADTVNAFYCQFTLDYIQ